MSLHDWAEGVPKSIRIRGVTVSEGDWLNVQWSEGIVAGKNINIYTSLVKILNILEMSIRGIKVKDLDGRELLLQEEHIVDIKVRPKVIKMPKLRSM